MNTVTIIGHGPSPVGKSWGRKIDACDVVIRMFDCAWQDAEDYGTRYDIGLVTMSEQSLRRFQTEATRKPSEWWIYRQDGALFDVKTAAPQTVFDLDDDHDFALQAGAQTLGGRFAFTRGTAAAIRAVTALHPARLILVGFDEVEAGCMMPEAYPEACAAAINARRESATDHHNDAERAAQGSRTLGHDYSIEMDYLRLKALSHGVELKHAQEVWIK